MRLLTRRVVDAQGAREELVDRAGAVFAPVPEAAQPVWFYGPPDREQPMFTCPVSAIPAWVHEIVALWHACRLMRTLPVAGAFVDQPYIVRRAFPVLEEEMVGIERRQQSQSGGAMATMLAALLGRR